MKRFALALIASVALANAELGATWRTARCGPPPDPAAVAAREQAQQKATRLVAVGGGVAMAVGLLIFGWNWLRETRAAVAYSRRELTPWERAEREM